MPTYLYCLVLPASPGDRADSVPQRVRGIDGAAVRSLPSSAGALWTSTLAAPPAPTAERALAHNAVCDAAISLGGTVLPVRFGAVFPTDAALTASIESRRDALARTANRIGTAVEMTIAIPAPAGAPNPPDAAESRSPGHAYMAGSRLPPAQRMRFWTLRPRSCSRFVKWSAPMRWPNPFASLSHLQLRSSCPI